MTSNIYSSRTSFMSSSKCNEEYATRVQHGSNNIVQDNPIVMSNNPQLKNATPSSQSH